MLICIVQRPIQRHVCPLRLPGQLAPGPQGEGGPTRAVPQRRRQCRQCGLQRPVRSISHGAEFAERAAARGPAADSSGTDRTDRTDEPSSSASSGACSGAHARAAGDAEWRRHVDAGHGHSLRLGGARAGAGAGEAEFSQSGVSEYESWWPVESEPGTEIWVGSKGRRLNGPDVTHKDQWVGQCT